MAASKGSDRKLVIDAAGEREIVMTRVFAAPRRLVFDAWTRPEQVSRWLLGPDGWTMPICEIDLRVGGAWRYVLRHPGGREMTMRGVYREIDRPGRLVSTESFDGMPGEGVNTFLLDEVDGVTTVTIRSLYESRAIRDGVLQSGMEKGAARSFDRLEDILAEA
jgi:uncharacterized protein YndB with AHSA1/START domain